MIGLGSNRLTVCRRGGMAITQAGRGGMEWLAGGRKPSWASPYSAQATAWLKEKYPDKWDYLMRYGFSHPEVVPLINENPMYAFSWLYNQSGLVFKMDCGYKCTTQKWIDEINGLEFIGNGSVALTDGIPTFGGSGYYVCSNPTRHTPNTHTIEVVYIASTGINHVYIENFDYSGALAAGTSGTTIITSCGDGLQLNCWTVPTDQFNTFSRATSGYINRQASSQLSRNSWSSNGKNKAYIGCRSENYQVANGMKVYAIRIYNRLLTEQEILANQAIDLQRWQSS